MQPITPHLIAAALAVLIALGLTASVLGGGPGRLDVPTTALRLSVPTRDAVLPPERVLAPLVEALASAPDRNPFTLAEGGHKVELRVPVPPAPPLDLPQPPALPLVER